MVWQVCVPGAHTLTVTYRTLIVGLPESFAPGSGPWSTTAAPEVVTGGGGGGGVLVPPPQPPPPQPSSDSATSSASSATARVTVFRLVCAWFVSA